MFECEGQLPGYLQGADAQGSPWNLQRVGDTEFAGRSCNAFFRCLDAWARSRRQGLWGVGAQTIGLTCSAMAHQPILRVLDHAVVGSDRAQAIVRLDWPYSRVEQRQQVLDQLHILRPHSVFQDYDQLLDCMELLILRWLFANAQIPIIPIQGQVVRPKPQLNPVSRDSFSSSHSSKLKKKNCRSSDRIGEATSPKSTDRSPGSREEGIKESILVAIDLGSVMGAFALDGVCFQTTSGSRGRKANHRLVWWHV